MRSRTSRKTRSAMRWSRSERSREATTSTALPMDSEHSSKMLWPPTVTASDSGFSRAPPHVGQGTSRRKFSRLSRRNSESASVWRRSSHGTMPS